MSELAVCETDGGAVDAGPGVFRHDVTGEELTGWRDEFGLWLDDPSDPGYAWDDGNWHPVSSR